MIMIFLRINNRFFNNIFKSGSFYSYGDIRLGQGREQVKEYLKENKDTAIDIENKIRESRNNKANL